MPELQSTLIIMVIIMFIGFIIEALVEFLFAPLFDKVAKLTPFKWLQMYIAVVVGVIAAFTFQLDLIHILSLFLSQVSGTIAIIAITPFGLIVTGISMGRGSNFIHDIFTKFFNKKILDDLGTPAAQA